MNYKYRIDKDVEFVLSGEEHEKVKQSVAQGNNNVFLRDGSLMINMPFVRSINETDDMTDMELKKKSETLRLRGEELTLAQERAHGHNFLAKTHDAFYANMGWEHGENCICKKNVKYVEMRKKFAESTNL